MPVTIHLRKEDLQGIKANLESKVRAEVQAKGYKDVELRDILPKTDLGLANEAWVVSIPTGANSVTISKTLPNDTAIVFYGVSLPNKDDVTVIRFRLGDAKIKEVYEVEIARALQEPVVYFEEGVMYKPNEVMNIDVFAKSSGDKQVILIGVVAEPRGKTIVGPVE
jgi:hypothetical protein